MTERVFLKPAPLTIEGVDTPRKVRKPIGPYLAAKGEWVNLDTYWRRKLLDGEVLPEADAVEPTEAMAGTPEASATPAETPLASTKSKK